MRDKFRAFLQFSVDLADIIGVVINQANSVGLLEPYLKNIKNTGFLHVSLGNVDEATDAASTYVSKYILSIG